MEKITVLSPVHIGTGRNIEPPSYQVKHNTYANRYEFNDILAEIPARELMDPRFLEELQKRGQKAKILYDKIYRYVDYSKLEKKYTLKCQLEHELKEYAYDVSEQVKSLDRPYIPASSIKGALMNAWIYDLLKNNQEIKQRIEPCLYELSRNGKTEAFFLALIFGQSEGREYSEFLKDIRSCLICNDLFFEKMVLCESFRITKTQEIPLSYKECIAQNQTIEKELFHVDQYQLAKIKEKYASERKVCKIIDLFVKENLLSAMNVYTKDMLEEEFKEDQDLLYADYDGVQRQLFQLRQAMIKSVNDRSCYLRIGNGTNYFFKTISLFIKTQYPDLYAKHFEYAFSPVSPKQKRKLNPKTMPSTRVLFSEDDQNFTLSGFIKITL